jgi:hypothetical protein
MPSATPILATMSPRGSHHNPPTPRYEIRVRGRLGVTILQAFPDLAAQLGSDSTLLRGSIADQAALHGVLEQIEALGLELLELRQLPPAE